jgi:cephalosporin-C deacetylase-like acetyl esterase
MNPSKLYVTKACILNVLPMLCIYVSSVMAQIDPQAVSLDTVRMNSFLDALAEDVGREAWERINSQEKIHLEKTRLRKEFLFMIGLDPLPPRTPLNLKIVRKIENKEYSIEVLHFQSLPGFYVTANLYKPKKGKPPYPGVIWGPGHSSHLYGSKALRQNYAIPWVRNGYVCMVVDPIQVAEVLGVHRGVSGKSLHHWYARGYTPIGIEVWNAMRAVDYLIERQDVDGSKLTINGVSGGGHLSWMAGAADERIAVVQPVAGTADVENHVKLDLQRMHCDCAYFINTYQHDWSTLTALISPRPLLMHNSTEDAYYPPSGYKAVLGKAKELYGFFGIPEKTDEFEVPGRHGYTKEQREKAVEWSDRWLKAKKTTVREKPFDEVSPEQLAALGGQYGKHPENINDRIQELLIPTARIEPCNDLANWERKKAEITENLRKVVFRNMPSRATGVTKDQGERNGLLLETEPGILIGMYSNLGGPEKKSQPAMLYIASEGETMRTGWSLMSDYPYDNWTTSLNMVYPRGIGEQVWNSTIKKKYERTSMVLGRTLDDMRLYDILCAVDYITGHQSYDGNGVTVVGKGASGILGAYAALLDPRITRVILFAPTLTHENGPVFLNVLRYTDIPQTLAMLAPREVVFLTNEIDRFGYTRGIYKLYNAERKFRRCYTVAQALNLSD